MIELEEFILGLEPDEAEFLLAADMDTQLALMYGRREG